ncbi:cytochrome P450 18a1-like [Planococcus citri]|uniref:cytochrome P450 18a1-like n=1 Tax=Planococcus citri TaxID=170843 RepID=UPI0031F9CD9B
MALRFGRFWNYFDVTALSFIAVCLSIILVYRKYKNLPPGPWGLPFVGYLCSIINENVHDKYFELSKKYGKIFSVKLGQKNVVIISDPRMLKEAFNKEEFNGRPSNEFYKLLGGYGIINTQGHIWKEQRRFLHACLRWFGMTIFNRKNNNQLESRIMGEVKLLLENLKNQKGRAIDLNHSFVISISNVICSLLMSVRFSFNDPVFKNLMMKMEEGFRLFGGIVLLNYFPFLRFFPFFLKEFKKIEENKKQTHQFFQNIIDDHKRSFNESNTRDVLDFYLSEIQRAERNGNSENLFDGKDHNSQIRQIIVDLYTAGMETTKTTLHWSIIYMLHYPDVAKSIQAELDAVVGRKRLPTFEDLPYLPITESTILEVLRKSSIVPLGNSHATMKDVYFKGYLIPKNTEIVPLIYAVNNDPELWESPEKFLPSRFLNSEGRVTKPDHFIPFGIGRRTCLGEFLARMEIFLFFSCILHTFNIQLPEGHTLPSLEGYFGITLNPGAYKVQLIERPFSADVHTSSVLPEILSNKRMPAGSH